MNAKAFLSTIALTLAVMGLAALLELAVPLHSAASGRGRRRRTNLGVTAATILFNGVLAALGVAFAAAVPPGPALLSSVPFGVEVVLSVIAFDFGYGYLAHRLMHESGLLWRVHRVHHGDAFVDVTTSIRNHPLESAWRQLFLFVPAWILGSSATAIVAFRMLSTVNALFEHANIRLPQRLDAWLSQLWVSPNVHKVHHSRDQRETDTNYGNLLTLHDRLLGTFTPSERALSVRYGLDDADLHGDESTVALLTMPFRSAAYATSRAQVPSSAAGKSA